MTDDATLLDELLEQEERLVFDRFDNETAILLGTRILERARSAKQAVVVDISRGDQRLFYAALAGTSPDNEFWVAGKIAVVKRFGHSSFYVGQKARIRGVDFADASLVDKQQFRAHGGCFPIIVANVGIVGTATVSGLPQAEDHALVVAVIEEVLAEIGSGEARTEVWTA
ncbi:heme-degrading domain-containing protein [Mesorhizobium sp. BR1-1-16]|uniref:heme-degrading domain-containing protein n=1 Tax=Mesorhizobium sp. BR1-1-16 TaxID=2876653 RepID=UPI001CCFB8DE|nr:heme-degrading domain-containing protein [Mesorhizobium sp. BR1-1-16]MBZ9937375.1 heme-degrading domain-containing protein [Mesorhizobium sp. BR1-1-16]